MPFVWNDEQVEAFCELKLRLVSAPKLASSIDDGRYVLDSDNTDASSYKLGAVLQLGQDGVFKITAYGSRSLNKAERNYCITSREMLAVVYGLKQF